jgi:sulfotransferase
MRRAVQVTSKDHVLKVVSMTRFHFVAGLPNAGARCLAAILAQNPRFCVSSDSPAECVFSALSGGTDSKDMALSDIDAETRRALLRASLDAVHHARPMESVVFDNNVKWLAHVTLLAEMFPLSRFVIMVRDPARIAAEMARETGGAQSPSSLMSEQGIIGAPVRLVQEALNSPSAKRLLLVDYDRLRNDPERVLAAMYAFVGEAPYAHDFRALPSAEPEPQVTSGWLTRRVAALGEATSHRMQKTPLPIWRRSTASGATMLLSETG